MSGTKLKALIRPLSRGHDEVDTVDLELMNPDGSPYGGGGGAGGGGVSFFVNGRGLQKTVLGTSDGLYFDGTESNLDLVGIDLQDGQSLRLPPGIYASSWQIGFNIANDDGVDDTVRLFRAEIQPLGAQLEWSPQKPEGGWGDYNPYVMENLAWNFVVPEAGNNDLIITFDGSTASDNGVTYYLSFLLTRLGDIPA
jgi:hypothetical protein